MNFVTATDEYFIVMLTEVLKNGTSPPHGRLPRNKFDFIWFTFLTSPSNGYHMDGTGSSETNIYSSGVLVTVDDTYTPRKRLI